MCEKSNSTTEQKYVSRFPAADNLSTAFKILVDNHVGIAAVSYSSEVEAECQSAFTTSIPTVFSSISDTIFDSSEQ